MELRSKITACVHYESATRKLPWCVLPWCVWGRFVSFKQVTLLLQHSMPHTGRVWVVQAACRCVFLHVQLPITARSGASSAVPRLHKAAMHTTMPLGRFGCSHHISCYVGQTSGTIQERLLEQYKAAHAANAMAAGHAALPGVAPQHKVVSALYQQLLTVTAQYVFIVPLESWCLARGVSACT